MTDQEINCVERNIHSSRTEKYPLSLYKFVNTIL